MKKENFRGFTIVELLVVITIIATLAVLTIVAYRNIQQRSIQAKQDADVSQLIKAIMVAREKEGKPLRDITGSTWTIGGCEISGNNPDATEPRDLSKTHPCWMKYDLAISRIAIAAGSNLDRLRDGDARGNPYGIDENEAESTQPCNRDVIVTFAGLSTTRRGLTYIPLTIGQGC